MSVLPVSLCKGGEVGRGVVVSRASPCLGHQQPDEQTEQEEGWVVHVVVGRLLGVPGA